MSVIEGKVWGSTEPILQSPAVEIHRINVKKDGIVLNINISLRLICSM